MAKTVLLFLGCLAVIALVDAGVIPPQQINSFCGECPPGTTRELVVPPFCGRCLAISQTCQNGFYWEERTSKCEGCPCRVTEASCSKASDGRVICQCPVGYQGERCESCSYGYFQEGRYPNRCIQSSIFTAIQPVSETPVGCPDPSASSQPLSRSSRSTQQGGNTCPPAPATPYNCAPTTNCPAPPVCPPFPVVPWCPPLNPVTPACPQCPYQPVNPPCGPPACPVNAPACPVNCPPENPYPCPTAPVNPPAPAPACPVYPPGIPPYPCPAPVYPPSPACPSPCPQNAPCPPSTIIVPSPPCPVQPPCPPGNNCPPACAPVNLNCPQVPGCPPYPPCPGPVPCPTIPSCPVYPPCPQIPPIPPFPQCPTLPPIPPCPECNQVIVPPTPPCPAPIMICNLTCGCCNETRYPPYPPPPPPSNITTCKTPCLCDLRGTVRQECHECYCKVNVEGDSCDTCKPGYFGLRYANKKGCSKCFCSGVTDECWSSVVAFQAVDIDVGRIKLVERKSGKVISHSRGMADISSFESGHLKEYYWVLPEYTEDERNRISTYGSKIEAIRQYGSALVTALSVPGNDVVIEGTSGLTLFWSATKPCEQNKDNELSVKIDESENWMTWRNEGSSRATRADIMTVLASVHRILIRALFTPTRMEKSSIKRIRVEEAVKSADFQHFSLQVEECQCPTGYNGSSCEICATGFYRDTTDMTISVFGNCKRCPCKNSETCTMEFGSLVCKCKKGFSGPRCEDRDFVSVTLNPSRVRACYGDIVTFNCTYVSSSFVRLEFDTMSGFPKFETDRAGNGISTTIRLSSSSPNRLVCRVVEEKTTFVIAEVYSNIFAHDCGVIVKETTIGPIVQVESCPKFICIFEDEDAKFNCSAWASNSAKLPSKWTRAGIKGLPRSAKALPNGDLNFINARKEDTGTYHCVAGESGQLQLAIVQLIVRDRVSLKPVLYPVFEQDDAPFESNVTALDAREEVGTETPLEVPALYVTIDPPFLEVVEGEPATFHCKSQGENDELSIYWRKTDGQIEADAKTNTSILQFNSVRKDNEGEYHCIVSNKFGKSSSSAYLRVINLPADAVAPSPPVPEQPFELVVSITPSNQVLRPGDKAVLACEGNESDLKIFWTKENGTIRSATEDEMAEPHLVLYSVIPSDSGWYICSASSQNAQKLATGRVELVVKPEEIAPTMVISQSSPHLVKVGHRAHLDCQTFGEPLPVVTWSRFLHTADGYQEQTLVEATTTNLVYEIRRVVKEHEGDYYCTGRNEVGSDRVNIRLEVEEGIICKEDEFRCHSGDQCVNLGDRCDKEKDCRDGSDERHCNRHGKPT